MFDMLLTFMNFFTKSAVSKSINSPKIIPILFFLINTVFKKLKEFIYEILVCLSSFLLKNKGVTRR